MEFFEQEFEFNNFSVILTNNSIRYRKYNKDKQYRETFIPTVFDIRIDKEEAGRGIFISYKDRWGSEMKLVHYFPSDLQGMFEFIARGYQINIL